MEKFDLEKDLEKLGEDFKLSEAQEYIGNMFEALNWDKGDPRDRAMYLAEEVGELCHALRKELGHNVDMAKETGDTVEDELADVFITLCAFANSMNVDLGKAFLRKQAMNCKREWSKEGQVEEMGREAEI